MLKTTLLSALCGLALAGNALAQENKPVPRTDLEPADRMAMHVMSYAFEHMADLIPPEKKLQLAMVAKQRAAADSCDGFEIDNQKYIAVMNATMADVVGLVEDGKENLVTDRVMFGFGMMMGGELALAAYDPEGYCAYGAELRAELEEDDKDGLVFVLKSAD